MKMQYIRLCLGFIIFVMLDIWIAKAQTFTQDNKESATQEIEDNNEVVSIKTYKMLSSIKEVKTRNVFLKQSIKITKKYSWQKQSKLCELIFLQKKLQRKDKTPLQRIEKFFKPPAPYPFIIPLDYDKVGFSKIIIKRSSGIRK